MNKKETVQTLEIMKNRMDGCAESVEGENESFIDALGVAKEQVAWDSQEWFVLNHLSKWLSIGFSVEKIINTFADKKSEYSASVFNMYTTSIDKAIDVLKKDWE